VCASFRSRINHLESGVPRGLSNCYITDFGSDATHDGTQFPTYTPAPVQKLKTNGQVQNQCSRFSSATRSVPTVYSTSGKQKYFLNVAGTAGATQWQIV
jgi:hypothetical protein